MLQPAKVFTFTLENKQPVTNGKKTITETKRRVDCIMDAGCYQYAGIRHVYYLFVTEADSRQIVHTAHCKQNKKRSRKTVNTNYDLVSVLYQQAYTVFDTRMDLIIRDSGIHKMHKPVKHDSKRQSTGFIHPYQP